MIRLGELVGAVLNELTIASTNAALFGAQMAADFRDHEILRHLDISVFKIGEAEISVQFAVANVSVGRRMAGTLPLEPSEIVAPRIGTRGATYRRSSRRAPEWGGASRAIDAILRPRKRPRGEFDGEERFE